MDSPLFSRSFSFCPLSQTFFGSHPATRCGYETASARPRSLPLFSRTFFLFALKRIGPISVPNSLYAFRSGVAQPFLSASLPHSLPLPSHRANQSCLLLSPVFQSFHALISVMPPLLLVESADKVTILLLFLLFLIEM